MKVIPKAARRADSFVIRHDASLIAVALIPKPKREYKQLHPESDAMTDTAFESQIPRFNWVRLRTLIILRWIAITGQLIAITVAIRYFNLNLNVGLCFLAIGLSIVANLVAVFIYPENKRLSHGEVTAMLIFDILAIGIPGVPDWRFEQPVRAFDPCPCRNLGHGP